jgi:hypothetical protein
VMVAEAPNLPLADARVNRQSPVLPPIARKGF